MITRQIGFLLFEGMNALDLTGPMETFHTVADVCPHSPYELVFIGPDASTFTSESGLQMTAGVGLNACGKLDTLIIPGGSGSRSTENQRLLSPWLAAISTSTRRMVSICTGAFLLASCGLLNGKKATTHWAFTDELVRTYPSITLAADALYVDTGNIATSAGITSGIDLALKLIDDDLGTTVATDVARYLVVHLRRAGDQAQFSVPLQYQIKAGSPFADLTGWILNNLSSELSIRHLANHCGMSERNFCRRFQQRVGTSPGRYVEHLRLDYARELLVAHSWPLSQISGACGYSNPDMFRRAFARRFGLSPNAYRLRFTR
ncbi:GlxA family transcriptional regulator [Alteromonas halophila]|uniref:Transcriptional regulator n=1 Tax=Alteromonas halophila TaxID=516698 RepID=A0A918N197_9ALTE|nr:DJ-1/PfpI family protein [Alteromonas halophila]GGW93391.1 transcriptional regulator [Alteromonas halophila]